MKKNKLEESYTVDFNLLGVVCNKKEYQLAWHLNKVAKITLIKQEDIKIEYANKSNSLVSNLKHETDFFLFELLQNRLIGDDKSLKKFLLPELKEFDYLIKYRDDTEMTTPESINEILKRISIVDYSMILNFETLKSKENFFY